MRNLIDSLKVGQFKEPPPSLSVLYQNIEVARLVEERNGEYVFVYMPTFRAMKLLPIAGFPDVNKSYRSRVLWPFFSERIPNLRRPEIQKIIRDRNLEKASKLQLIAELGSQSITDSFVIRPLAA